MGFFFLEIIGQFVWENPEFTIKVLGLVFKSIKMYYISSFYTVQPDAISNLNVFDGSLHELKLQNEVPSLLENINTDSFFSDKRQFISNYDFHMFRYDLNYLDTCNKIGLLSASHINEFNGIKNFLLSSI